MDAWMGLAMIVEGLLFSMVAALMLTWWALRAVFHLLPEAAPSPRVAPPMKHSSISTGHSVPIMSRSGRTVAERSLCRIWNAVWLRLMSSWRWNWTDDIPGVWVIIRYAPQNHVESAVWLDCITVPAVSDAFLLQARQRSTTELRVGKR